MHDWREEKYVNLLSSQLRNFKRKKPGLWNFNCPLCADAQKVGRGYIYTKKGELKFHCHNCTQSLRFTTFLKKLNANLYLEFVKERLADKKDDWVRPVEEKKAEPVFDVFKDLKTLADLSPTHPARMYILKRQIPDGYLKRLFYAPYFKHWVNTVIPQKFNNLDYDEPRLVIPYIDKDVSIIGFTGRSFDPKADLRYIEIPVDPDKRRVFNLDQVDLNKPHYVVEGPIDAMFLPTCIAAGGSTLRQIMNEHSIGVFDNQPRNVEIVKLIEKCIQAGRTVVIWPSWLAGKDVNEFVLNGHSPKELVGIITENTYSGLRASAKFNKWKKI